MIFQGFLILLLLADGLTLTPNRHLQTPLEEANCYTRNNHAVCYNLKDVPNLSSYFVTLADSDLDLKYDLNNFNPINTAVSYKFSVFYSFVKNKLNIVDKNNRCFLKCLLHDLQNTVFNTSNVEVNNYSSENVCFTTSMREETAENPVTTFAGAAEVRKSNICNRILICNTFDRGTCGKKLETASKLVEEPQTSPADKQQIILKFNKFTSSEVNTIGYTSGLNTNPQNAADKDILVRQNITNKLKKTKNGHYIGDLEIFFRISIFLMLFIIVFMFNIYYCGSIMYSVYKKRFVALDG